MSSSNVAGHRRPAMRAHYPMRVFSVIAIFGAACHSAYALSAPTLWASSGGTTVPLGWSSVSGATSYEVERATTSSGSFSVIGTVAATDFVDSPPSPGTTYYYEVMAQAGSTLGPASNQIAISATNGLVAGATADSFTQSNVPTKNNGTSTSLVVDGASAGTDETFLTFPIPANVGSIGTVQLEIYKYAGTTDSETVFGISPSSWTQSGVTWNTQPSLTGATVAGTLSIGTTDQYYIANVTSYVQAQAAAGATSVSFAIASTGAYQMSYYSNRAASNPPQLICSVTPQTVPSSVTATPGDTQNLLTWNPVPSATGYNVYRSTTSGSGFTEITTAGPSAANAYIDGGLTNGTTYYYEVTAIVGGTEGPDSAQVSAAPLAQDANWVVTPPVIETLPAPVTTANSQTVSTTIQTSLVAMANVFGSIGSTPISANTSSSEGGTWTFAWTGTTWPSLYVIQHLTKDVYSASINDGTGTATVSVTGGAVLVQAAEPVTGTQIISTPTITNSFATPDLSNPLLTNNRYLHVAGPMPAPGQTSGTLTGWSEAIDNSVTSQTAYTSQWFQANFSTPQSILISITVPTSSITVSGSMGSSLSDANTCAQGLVSDVFSGQ